MVRPRAVVEEQEERQRDGGTDSKSGAALKGADGFVREGAPHAGIGGGLE